MEHKNFRTRDYTPTDFDAVNKVWQATNMGGKHRGDNEETILKTIQQGGKLIVMENIETKQIVGTSWLSSDARRIYLHHFGIIPEFQGMGLSKILLTESLAFAKKEKLQIKLEVHKNNIKAINLYKQAGFEYLGDYDVYIIRDVSSTKLL